MASGLDGVVAADTVLSHTDRTDGMVWVRGHDLPTLVAGFGFEGTVALLWDGFAGDGLTRAGIAASLGHRVFAGNDPRAEAMRRSVQAMGPQAGRLAFADRLEKAVAVAIDRVKPGRKLPPNLEIMATLLLDAVDIPRDAFTLVFAVGRSAGWLAQQKTGRMIRPVSACVGPPIG